MLNMNNKQEALEIIYARTYAKAYVIAKQFVKNEEDALDILQEAYISVFNHMESLQDESKLDKWVNMIVANRCKDWLRKKQVILFTDMGEEAEDDYEATIEDNHIEFLPEASVDYAETKKLMAEILDALPEDQKMCILMYYYDELSVNEIAEGLGCSTGTVKSRLNYARKKIKEEVELLEKKGTKLYGIAPLPFIVWMLKGMEANATDSLKTAGILQTVVNVSAGGKNTIVNSTLATRNITRKMVFGILQTKKAIAIISSIVVLGAVTTTYLALRNDSNKNLHNAKQETISKTDEETIKKDEGLKDTAVSEEIKETENADVPDALENNETSTNTTTNTETSNRTETTNKTETTTRPETSQPSTKPTTPTGTQAGLYQNGVLIKEWDKLIAEGTLSVDNDGILTSGYSYETETNSSSDKLAGKLIIDNSVKNLGMGAFSYCEKLTDIILGSSVTEISKGAFFGCKNLKSIHISSSVTKIYSETFYGCQCLESISVDKNNTIYDSRNNCNAIIRKSDNMLMLGCKSTVIPSSVSSIGYGSFHGSVGMTSITIPESVVEIHPMAFEQCINLTTINYLGSQSQWESIEKYSQQFETVQINFAK